MKIFSGVLVLALASLINPASAGGCDTIFEIVEDDSTYDTLTAALELTGLDDALDGGGDKTLFAPKDSAFSGKRFLIDFILARYSIEPCPSPWN